MQRIPLSFCGATKLPMTQCPFILRSPGLSIQPGPVSRFLVSGSARDRCRGQYSDPSTASTPAEKDLMVATRMRDTAFKRVLKTIATRKPVQDGRTFGFFTFHSNASRPSVFLAGGIGITPFRSMTVKAARKDLPAGSCSSI